MQEFIGSVVETPKRVRRTFSKQFKAQLVRLVEDGEESLASIAQEHEINANLLHKWVVLAKERNDAPAMVPVSVSQVAKVNSASVEICAQGCTIKLFSDWEPEKVAALIKSLS